MPDKAYKKPAALHMVVSFAIPEKKTGFSTFPPIRARVNKLRSLLHVNAIFTYGVSRANCSTPAQSECAAHLPFSCTFDDPHSKS